MRQFIKRLLCKHDYEYIWSHLIDTGMRKLVVRKCKHCGKLKVYIV